MKYFRITFIKNSVEIAHFVSEAYNMYSMIEYLNKDKDLIINSDMVVVAEISEAIWLSITSTKELS